MRLSLLSLKGTLLALGGFLIGLGALSSPALAAPASAYAECFSTGEVCVDSGTKTINGLEVTRDCWEYRKTFACYTPVENECAVLEANPTATLLETACSGTDVNGECYRERSVYWTEAALSPIPAGVAAEAPRKVIVNEYRDTTDVDALTSQSRCSGGTDVGTTLPTYPGGQLPPYLEREVDAGPVCIAPEETRTINGLEVTRECWAWRYDVDCFVDTSEYDYGTCDTVGQPGDVCHKIGEQCADTSVATLGGEQVCTAMDVTYQCKKPDTVSTFNTCNTTEVCSGGNCFDTSSPDATDDFLAAASAMEAARQAGQYALEEPFKIFKGEYGKCRTWLRWLGAFGQENCCKAAEGENAAQSNQSIMSKAAMGAGKAIVSEGYSVASDYMYDFMFQNGNGWMADKAIESWFSGSWGGGFGGFSPSFGMYGFSVSWVGAGAGLGGTGLTFAFDPTSFAIAVAIQVIQSYVACPESEIKTSIKIDAGLCVYLGQYCSKDKRFIGCLRKHAGYCCFNSKLARIIHEQGRPQIAGFNWPPPTGRWSWRGNTRPNCDGFTEEEFKQLDFSKIDLSEFFDDILKNATIPSGGMIGQVADRNQQIIQQKIQSYRDSHGQ